MFCKDDTHKINLVSAPFIYATCGYDHLKGGFGRVPLICSGVSFEPPTHPTLFLNAGYFFQDILVECHLATAHIYPFSPWVGSVAKATVATHPSELKKKRVVRIFQMFSVHVVASSFIRCLQCDAFIFKFRFGGVFNLMGPTVFGFGKIKM